MDSVIKSWLIFMFSDKPKTQCSAKFKIHHTEFTYTVPNFERVLFLLINTILFIYLIWIVEKSLTNVAII